MKQKIISIISIIIFALVVWYFMLPPINLSSPTFWVYLLIVVIFSVMVLYFTTIETIVRSKRFTFNSIGWPFKVIIGIFGVYFLILIINLFCSPLFNSNKYANRIVVDETRTFTEDVAPVDFNKIPLLDKVSSQKLGDRIMGQATEWVSQFYVSDLYTQINYNEKIIRVTPIEYDGIIKYFTNRKNGIKGYITVDSVNGESKLVTMDKGMHYMPSAYFFENLYRKLRINYPTQIFDEASFEIDNNGHPYWIVPTIKYVGVGLRKEISGVVILDAVSGESKKYAVDEVPKWVDHVYPANLIIEQMDNWGEYKNGFFNSIFGQKNVVNTTEGYNYLVMDDDVYLYTGITSVSNDQSNLGFVLVNMRTKETHYYSAPGAEEFSAIASAEGQVQEKKYKASFPLLVNLNNRPTYLLSLKDNAGLVKMYAFVDVADYQKVTVTDATLGIETAASKYLAEINNEVDTSKLEEKEIIIKEIENVTIDGNTYYYIIDSENKKYSVSIKINKDVLPFISDGDKLKVKYTPGDVNQIVSVDK